MTFTECDGRQPKSSACAIGAHRLSCLAVLQVQLVELPQDRGQLHQAEHFDGPAQFGGESVEDAARAGPFGSGAVDRCGSYCRVSPRSAIL